LAEIFPLTLSPSKGERVFINSLTLGGEGKGMYSLQPLPCRQPTQDLQSAARVHIVKRQRPVGGSCLTGSRR